MNAPTTSGPYSFERLTSFDNLYEASRLARRGKRDKPAVARFEHNLAENLLKLQDELRSGSYQPGPYREFEIFEPARRFISAAPYRDRVVHHALCRLIQPLFERSFIYDSYANREGKGTHRALDRCTHYARRCRYVLQGDIRLFFPSLDHQILAARLERKIYDPQVLALSKTILSHSNQQPDASFYFPGDDLFTPSERRRGLPIGNLTSQFWANVYLDPFDHFFRDDLGVTGYIRYVDDFLVFGDDKSQLAEYAAQARDRLAALRLVLHPRKTRIYPVIEGIPFLGFRVFPHHRRLLPGGVKRARRRFARQSGSGLPMAHLTRSVAAWVAHARHGDTLGLRRRLLAAVVRRAGDRQRAAGRLVEQQSRARPLGQPQQQPPGQP